MNMKYFPTHGVWTREQTILALYFYIQTPFGKIHSKNPQIIEWANLIGRSANSLSLKMVNISSIDPLIVKSGRTGMKNSSKLDNEVWRYYINNYTQLAQDAQNLLALINNNFSDTYPLICDNDNPLHIEALASPTQSPEFTGYTKESIVKMRIHQNFFRKMVLSNFDEKCCISGINQTSFLVASHIVSWSESKENRLNPHNGLLLSALYDKAFDQYLITFNNHFEVMLSPLLLKILSKAPYDCGLLEIEGRKMFSPVRFKIDEHLMQIHNKRFFEKIKIQ